MADTEFDLNLDTMSLDDLRELRGQIDKAIAGFNERKRREAMAAAEDAVRALGFNSLADVTRRAGKGRNAAAKPAKAVGNARYVNPDDASQTWSGRGRRPSWVNESLNNGKSLEDLAV